MSDKPLNQKPGTVSQLLTSAEGLNYMLFLPPKWGDSMEWR